MDRDSRRQPVVGLRGPIVSMPVDEPGEGEPEDVERCMKAEHVRDLEPAGVDEDTEGVGAGETHPDED